MTKEQHSAAFRFIVMIGVSNLFADLTYEGGRSIVGPFMAQLGATAAIVSIVSGLAEFVGYALRAASGFAADRTGRYWSLTALGYTINMLAVPALSLAGSWPVAACLIAAERTGRAIRRPIVQGMISRAGKLVGSGHAFGLNEALDAAGATVGPLVVALILARHGKYGVAFAGLLVSALLCLIALFFTQRSYPNPEKFEPYSGVLASNFPTSYWLYLAAAAMVGFGFVDFSLIAFHFHKASTFSNSWIPISYGIAMGIGAITNFFLGRLYDQVGRSTLIASFLVSSFFAPLVFYGSAVWAVVGMALWGLGKGAQDTLLKAAISGLIPVNRRSTAFGIFDTAFGAAWLAGSIMLGLLYERSLPLLVAISVLGQLASLPIFFLASRAKSVH